MAADIICLTGPIFWYSIGLALSLIASANVKNTFNHYTKIRSRSNLTGAMAAERVLHRAGIYDVSIQRVAGNLTDHYDPRSKTLRLSDSTYGTASDRGCLRGGT